MKLINCLPKIFIFFFTFLRLNILLIKPCQRITHVWQKWRCSTPLEIYCYTQHLLSALEFVVKIATFAKRGNVIRNIIFLPTLQRQSELVKVSDKHKHLRKVDLYLFPLYRMTSYILPLY